MLNLPSAEESPFDSRHQSPILDRLEMFLLLASAALFLSVPASAATIIDFSAIPVNQTTNGFGANGGVQFVSPSTFGLEGVRVLLGATSPTSLDFQVIAFDGSLGDTTGVVIGTVAAVPVNGIPFSSFAAAAVDIDVTSLGLTLQQGTVYGFAFAGADANGVRGGSSGVVDTTPNVGTIFNGNQNGTFATDARFEIPFQAFGSIVPEPSTGLLLGIGVVSLVVRRIRPA